jgi:hypothetical protein
MAPITASQFGTNRFMERLLTSNSDQPLSSVQRFGCAAVSGGVSAFIGSPSEMIIIQQQVRAQAPAGGRRAGGPRSSSRRDPPPAAGHCSSPHDPLPAAGRSSRPRRPQAAAWEAAC